METRRKSASKAPAQSLAPQAAIERKRVQEQHGWAIAVHVVPDRPRKTALVAEKDHAFSK